ncbi:hypothetical protein BH10PSE7_BH10PSE7_14350 [soil metagenome]
MILQPGDMCMSGQEYRAVKKRIGSFKLSLHSATALSGAAAAVLLFTPAPARADSECGASVNGAVTCKPAGNPYATGITYQAPGDLKVNLAPGVAIEGTSGLHIDGTGDASLSVDAAADTTIAIKGDFASGLDILPQDGNVVINAPRSIKTDGFLAFGIRTGSGKGSVSIVAHDITTRGGSGINVSSFGGKGDIEIQSTGHVRAVTGDADDFLGGGNAVSGILVLSAGNVHVANTGTIEVDASPEFVEGTTLKLDADGINVDTQGDVVIDGTGSVTAIRKGSRGIVAKGNDITVRQASVATAGEDAPAIIVTGKRNVSIDVDKVVSARSDGIVARSSGTTGPGDVAIDAASVRTSGIGVYAESTNGAAVITAGNVTATGANKTGLWAVAATDAHITVTGADTAESGFGVILNSGGTATLDVQASGSVSGLYEGVLVQHTGEGVIIRNAGTIASPQYAIVVQDGPATIHNAGRIEGPVNLGAGDSLMTNSGTFESIRASNFGAGSDRFVNTGTLNILSQNGEQGGVDLLGLETFENSGALNLVDGRTDGYLYLPGDYVGSGGSLQVDVRLARGAPTGGDQLILDGAATGQTRVVPVGLDGQNGLLNPGATVVFAGPGSSPDAFTTDGLNVGFVEYGVVFDELDNTYTLVGAPGDAAYRTPKYIEGAQNLWYLSSDAWSAHLRGSRDGHRKDAAGQLWSQAYGSIDSRRRESDTSFAGVMVSSGSSYDQDYFGGQAGYDFMQHGGPNGIFTAGITGGYISSNLDFRGSRSEASYDAVNAGLSGSFSSGILFANILGKYDHYWIDAEDSSIGLDEKIGGNAYGVTAEIGLRAGSDRLFLEPVASLSYVRTALDGFSALSSDFDFDTADGLRGKLGARAGTTFDTSDGTRVSFYLGGNAVKEFEGTDGVTFRNNGQEIAIDNDRIGLYGEGIAGLDISNGRFSGFLEGFGKFGSSDDVRGGGGRAGISVDF